MSGFEGDRSPINVCAVPWACYVLDMDPARAGGAGVQRGGAIAIVAMRLIRILSTIYFIFETRFRCVPLVQTESCVCL